MTRTTQARLFRKFDGTLARFGVVTKRPRELPVIPNDTIEVDCGGTKVEVRVSPGQMINTKKVCKKYYGI